MCWACKARRHWWFSCWWCFLEGIFLPSISLKFYGQWLRIIRIFSMMMHCDDYNLMQGPEFATIINSVTSKKVAAWLWWWFCQLEQINGEESCFRLKHSIIKLCAMCWFSWMGSLSRFSSHKARRISFICLPWAASLLEITRGIQVMFY